MIRTSPGTGVVILGLVLLCPLLLGITPEPVRAHCAGYSGGMPPPYRRPAGTPGTRVDGSVTPKSPRWAKPPGPGTERAARPPTYELWWALNRDRLLSLRALRHRRALAKLGTEAAGGIDRERILAALRTAAGGRDPDLSTSAIIALGRARDAGALPLLLGLAEETEASMTAREVAALAVGMAGRGTKEARPFLTRVLGNMDLPQRLRGYAALGLGALGDPAALPLLLGRAGNPGESQVVAEAALVAAGLLGDDLAVPDLSRILTRSKPWTLRGHAALALGKLGSRRALPALTAALEDPEGNVRRQAALSIARLVGPKDEDAVGELLEMLVESPDPRDRSSAAVALGEAGIAAAEPALMEAYRAEDLDLAAHAAIGLALLARNSSDAELRERTHALFVSQLGEQADAEMLGFLATGLAVCGEAEDSALLRGAEAKVPLAAQALGILGDRASLPGLRAVLGKTEDPKVLHSTIWALGLAADVDSVPVILSMLKSHPREHVKGQAAVGLGGFRSGSVATALLECLRKKDQSSAVRAFAAVGLGLLVERPPPAVHEELRDHVNVDLLGPLLREVLTVL